MSQATQVIAITGASGMIGSSLSTDLSNQGHTVIPLQRGTRQPEGSDVFWDPNKQGVCDPQTLDGVDTVVHLAGENIASGRWTAAQKQRIRGSRVQATRNLVRSLTQMNRPPATFICASAIGIYGNRGSEQLTESSDPGSGFLAEVCRDWEEAATTAESAGMRVVCVRIGVVLSTQGGALAKMLTPFRFGLGGIVGNGNQYWSWIGLPDVVAILQEAITNKSLQGPVNAVSPNAVNNRQFTKVLGNVLNRPTIFPLPGFAAKLMLGEMAEDLLLSSAHVVPEVLTRIGFQFQHADLESCLKYEIHSSA
ncbi:MAG: TIGR01777 family oxidoreductase [Fuerstiella sp.]|nr:TIGR01777 family oxidoreductase [Fuerstiella sp.]